MPLRLSVYDFRRIMQKAHSLTDMDIKLERLEHDYEAFQVAKQQFENYKRELGLMYVPSRNDNQE